MDLEEGEAARNPLVMRTLATHPTSWLPSSVTVAMNLRMDGCIVPSETEGARVSYSYVVALDNFIDDDTRKELKDFLVGAAAPGLGGPSLPPKDRWERRTADMAGAAPTWGVKPEVIHALADGRPKAVIEVQSRLARLYPEYDIFHMPSAAIQGNARGGQGTEDHDSDVDCSAFLANAAVEGDMFRFHVDADPTAFPPGPWTSTYGDFFNGEPGKPLLVSLLLYLDEAWERDWAADTLFLDAQTDTGVMIRPRPGRALLMHQDVLHRVSAPSPAAGGRPRLSLVWKLAFLPKDLSKTGTCSIARSEWGPPVSFGSAAKVDAVKRQLARETLRQGI